MPSMLRLDKKSKKIAFKILGTPPNLRKDRRKDDKIEQRLLFEETSRAR